MRKHEANDEVEKDHLDVELEDQEFRMLAAVMLFFRGG